MCVCSRLAFLYLCVSCVCSTLSPGTSAMPPLSQFLTSLSKNMLIQTNLLFLLLRLLLSPPQTLLMGWTGGDMRSSPTARVFDFLPSFFFFFHFLYFILPVHIIPSLGWLQWETMRKPVNRKQLKRACFVRRSFLLRGKRRLPGGTTVVSTRGGGGSRQKSFILLLPHVLHGML